jgi:hypothetical protein
MTARAKKKTTRRGPKRARAVTVASLEKSKRRQRGGRKMSKHKDDDDTEVMERKPPAKREARDVVEPRSESALTVTVVNPSPPTNIATPNYGSPPTPDAEAYSAAGALLTPTAFAAPTKGSANEGAGTEVVDTDQNGTVSVTVMGNWTGTPNASHPSSGTPATPTITGLVPASTAASGGTMTLTINGTNFDPSSVAYVGGVAMTTSYVSPTQIQAMNAPKRSTAGTTPVLVKNGAVSSAPTNWTFT